MSSIAQSLTFLILLASVTPAPAGTAFENAAIYRSAVAAVTDRDPKLVHAKDADGGVVALTYARPVDNFVFAYRCRIDGDRVVWGDNPGRWRDGPKDAKVSFEVVGNDRLRIVINRPKGKPVEQLFDRELNEVH